MGAPKEFCTKSKDQAQEKQLLVLAEEVLNGKREKVDWLFDLIRSDKRYAELAAKHDEILEIAGADNCCVAHIISYVSEEAGLAVIEKAKRDKDTKILMLVDNYGWYVAHSIARSGPRAAREIAEFPDPKIKNLRDGRGITVLSIALQTMEEHERKANMHDAVLRPVRRGRCGPSM